MNRRKQNALDMMQEKQIDIMVLTAGTNLRYITNHKFSESERLFLYFLHKDGTGVYVIPEVEESNTVLDYKEHALTYKDGQKANDLLYQLQQNMYSQRNVAIESNKMRLFEFNFVQKLSVENFTDADQIMEGLRKQKDTEEIEKMQQAIIILEESLKATLPYIKIGKKETEIAARLEYEMRIRKSEGTPFSTIVASGYRGALPHGRASDKVIKDGDFIVIDFGSIYQGYVGDMTRTIGIGGITEEQKKAYKVVQKAIRKSIEATELGKTTAEVDTIARDIIDQSGYGDYFTHRLGHGIGLDAHESPYISQTDSNIFQEGMAFTIEPGIYIKNEFGIRIEDNIIMTNKGACNMMHMSHDLIIL